MKDGNKKGWTGCNVLHIATYKGYTAMVKFLGNNFPKAVTQVVKNNDCGYNGMNALHIAAQEGHIAICKFLLQHHPQLATHVVKNRGYWHGHNALQIAAKKGHTAIVDILSPYTNDDSCLCMNIGYFFAWFK